MAKQFAFDQILRNSSRIDLYESFVSSRALLMDKTGNKLLSRPDFPVYQHSAACGSCQIYLIFYFLDGRALSD